jgi:hypothetical protein
MSGLLRQSVPNGNGAGTARVLARFNQERQALPLMVLRDSKDPLFSVLPAGLGSSETDE